MGRNGAPSFQQLPAEAATRLQKERVGALFAFGMSVASPSEMTLLPALDPLNLKAYP